MESVHLGRRGSGRHVGRRCNRRWRPGPASGSATWQAWEGVAAMGACRAGRHCVCLVREWECVVCGYAVGSAGDRAHHSEVCRGGHEERHSHLCANQAAHRSGGTRAVHVGGGCSQCSDRPTVKLRNVRQERRNVAVRVRNIATSRYERTWWGACGGGSARGYCRQRRIVCDVRAAHSRRRMVVRDGHRRRHSVGCNGRARRQTPSHGQQRSCEVRGAAAAVAAAVREVDYVDLGGRGTVGLGCSGSSAGQRGGRDESYSIPIYHMRD